MEVDDLVGRGRGNLIVLVEDLSRYVWLESTVSCSAEDTARTILKWCGLFGVPKTFVSDGAPHYRNKVLKAMAEKLEVAYLFTVTHTSCINGTMKHII